MLDVVFKLVTEMFDHGANGHCGRTREAIAAGIVRFYHIAGALNPADLLSKHWGFAEGWPRLKPVLFWMGDTSVTKDGVAVKGRETSIRNDGECQDLGSKLNPVLKGGKRPSAPSAVKIERE